MYANSDCLSNSFFIFYFGFELSFDTTKNGFIPHPKLFFLPVFNLSYTLNIGVPVVFKPQAYWTVSSQISLVSQISSNQKGLGSYRAAVPAGSSSAACSIVV